MKAFITKTVLTVSLALSSLLAVGQASNYQLIRFDIGPAGTYAFAPDMGTGFGLSMELKANITNWVDIGLRQEVILFPGSNDSIGGQFPAFSISSVVAEFFFKDHGNIRPFASMGLGYYTALAVWSDIENISNYTSISTYPTYGSLGISPTLGIDLNWFRLSLTYNLLFTKRTVFIYRYTDYYPAVGMVPTQYYYEGSQSLSTNFLELKTTFRIGGKSKNDGNNGWRHH